MRVNYWTDPSNLNLNVGYGVAGYQIVTALQKLGHTVKFDDDEADVQLNFVQPEYYDRDISGQYRIGYTPWESTKIPDSWKYSIEECDEFWTTSPWCKNIFESEGIKVKNVYEHGISDDWKVTSRRGQRDKIRILHLGEPAPRKGGQMAFDAFMELFAGNPDVHYTIKGNNLSTVRWKDGYGSIIGPVGELPNVTVLAQQYSPQQMLSLVLAHDLLVYPSYGEGFGFIPLEAMATGMPVICTEEWAPYSEYLGDLALRSRYVDTLWEGMHPGQVTEPDKDHLIELMKFAVDNMDSLSAKFLDQTTALWDQYDWVNLTKKAFDPLCERLGIE